MPLLTRCLERKGCRLNRSVSSFWAFMPVGYFEFFRLCLFAFSLSVFSLSYSFHPELGLAALTGKQPSTPSLA